MTNDSPFHRFDRPVDSSLRSRPDEENQSPEGRRHEADEPGRSSPSPPPEERRPLLPPLHPKNQTRREFLWRSGGGLGGIALASLMGGEGLLAATTEMPGKATHPDLPHFPPRAKRVIQMFMAGAASHIDLF